MKKLIALAAVVAALVLPGSAQAWCWGETIEKGQYWYPTGTTFFYWWGYHRGGTLARAPGVQLTFAVTIPMVLAAIALVLASALA